MNDPWAFGWTQVLTLIGLGLSGLISFLGLRTFGKWQREKVQEKKLEIAFEALSLAYETGMIFDDIRRRIVHAYEWADMPTDKMTKEEIDHARSIWAILNRFDRHADFFSRVLKLQPKFMAVFGSDTEATFHKLHHARIMIQNACQVLLDTPKTTPGTDQWSLNLQMRSDIFDHNS